MYKVGITGGIGSGKSTVAAIFESIGIAVYYADAEAKRLMNRNKQLKQQIKALLSDKSYYRNGRLNRPYIASKVFKDKLLLKKLNNIVHPAVRSDFEEWSTIQKSPYVIEESALIFEIKAQEFFDATILVTADTEIKITRLLKRDKSDRKAILQRMKNQLSDKIKIPLADHIINNNGDESLIKQVMDIHKKILKKV